MRRREFIGIAGGAVVAVPFAGRAQQKAMPVIGVLGPNPKVYASLNLEQDLRDLGWDLGRNIQLLFKGSAGSNDELSRLAAELVAQHADVILSMGDQATIAAQQAAPDVPIVGITDDMVGSGLVASMARPGGNVTGFSILASELDVKRLQILHELVPLASRIGILADPTTVDVGAQLASAAQALHLDLATARAADPDAVVRALDQLVGAQIGAVPRRSSTMRVPSLSSASTVHGCPRYTNGPRKRKPVASPPMGHVWPLRSAPGWKSQTKSYAAPTQRKSRCGSRPRSSW